MKKLLLILTMFLIIPFAKVEAKEVDVTLFYGDGCPHCAKEEDYLKVLKSQLGKNVNIQTYEVWDNEENNELLTKVRTTLNDKGEGVPLTVIGGKVFDGFNDEIGKEIKKTILDNLKQNNINVVELVKDGKAVPTSTTLDSNPTIHFTLLGNTNVKKTSAATNINIPAINLLYVP